MTLEELKTIGAIDPETDLEEARKGLRRGEEKESAMPWIGRMALGLGAWLAGIFFIGFIAVFLDLNDDTPMAVAGGVLVIGGVALLRLKKNLFLEQLALALGLAGYIMVFIGVHDIHQNDLIGPFVAALILCIPVYWFSEHSVQRFFSGFWVWLTWWGGSIGNWSSKLNEPMFMLMLVAALSIVLAILGGIPRLSGLMWRPALWSSVVSLAGGLFWLTSSLDVEYGSVQVELIFGAAAAMGLFSVLWVLVKPQGKSVVVFVAFGVLLIGFGIMGAPGVIVSLGLLALAHARGERLLEGLSLGLLGLFLIAFYYHLGLPLNQKSITLMVAGVALLGLRWWLGTQEREPMLLAETEKEGETS